MRQRLPTSADDDGEDKAPGGRADRTPLNEALSLGPLYGILNQVAPLVRLYAVGTLIAQSSKAAGGVLWPMIAAVVSGLATKPLQNLAGALVPGDKESSAFHQARLAASQLLRAALQAILGTLALALVDLDACGLRAGRAGLATELAAGAAAAATMCAVWSIVPRILGVDRCEGLTMAGGTHDLSGASEDELLRGMRPTMHTAHLLGRCVCLTFDVVADALLFFVFLASAVHGDEPPSTRLYTTGMPVAPFVVVAFSYGSQHLRWRGEWALAAGFAIALLVLCSTFDGSLLTASVGMFLFAVFRYLRRSQDVRRFHAQ